MTNRFAVIISGGVAVMALLRADAHVAFTVKMI